MVNSTVIKKTIDGIEAMEKFQADLGGSVKFILVTLQFGGALAAVTSIPDVVNEEFQHALSAAVTEALIKLNKRFRELTVNV